MRPITSPTHRRPRKLIPFLALTLGWLASALVGGPSTHAADLSDSPTATPPPTRPNIVFLLIDDMGWPDLGCYGNTFHETPNIDRLAAQGIRFTDFYAATPVCSSTRSTIQTGQNSARTAVTDFIPGHWRPFEKLVVPPIEHQLRDNIRTPGDLLKSAGYVTGYFGKWHLGSESTHGPANHGYQVTARSLGDDFQRSRARPNPGPKRMDLLTDQTLWFIEQHQAQPFFVTLSHHAVHIPIEGRPATIEKYRDKPRPPTGVNHPGYAAMTEYLDDSVGRILDRLDQLKLTDRTIVVFTSDNGGLRKVYTGVGDVVSSNHPLRSEKGTLYEGGIRVPLIVRWPGRIRPRSTTTEPATTADLLPTFCELTETPLPDQPLDGLSLASILTGAQPALERPAIYFHYPHYHHASPAGAIRAGDWKLIEFFDGTPLELYNLKDDLGEALNLADNQRALAEELRARLAGWRDGINARMPAANPKHDPARAHEWYSRRTGEPLDLEAMRLRFESRP